MVEGRIEYLRGRSDRGGRSKGETKAEMEEVMEAERLRGIRGPTQCG